MVTSRVGWALLLASTLSQAAPDAGSTSVRDGGGCVVNPKARYRFHFDAAELVKVIPTVTDMTCKIVVIAPGAEAARITIATPEFSDFTAAEFFRAFVAAVELNGFAVTEKDGIVRIARAKP